MRSLKLTAVLLSSASAFALIDTTFAQAPDDILERVGKFKPTINFADTYGEKVLTIRAERIPGEPAEPSTHEVAVKPQKITAKIVANIEGFIFTGPEGELDDAMPVGIKVGTFDYASTLGQSNEAVKAGGFPTAKGKKATYNFFGTFDKPNGDTYEKKVGTLSFAWTPKRLTVTLSVTDIVAAGVAEIAASKYKGLYVDESENGNRPSGRAKFSNEAVEVSVTFGSTFGAQAALAKGTSTTSYKKYGRDEEGNPLEEFPVESVSLTGKADPLGVPTTPTATP